MIEFSVMVFLIILSIPFLAHVFGAIFMVLIYYSDLWVTIETIELGITESLYMSALMEASGVSDNV